MNIHQEYDLLVQMIDDTQKQIAKNPKDKLHLISELDALQNDLIALRDRKIGKRKPKKEWLEGFSFGERRTA